MLKLIAWEPFCLYTGSMKTTIDIPEDELRDAMSFLGARTKREAVVTALHEFNRRHRMARLVTYSGTCEFDTNAEIEAQEVAESDEERA